MTGDGSLSCFLDMILHLENHTIIKASDSCSLESNDLGMPSSLVTDVAKARQSVCKVNRLEKKYPNSQVWFSHDLKMFNKLRHAPEYYC